MKERFLGSAKEIFSNLDALIERLENPKFENIAGFMNVETSEGAKFSKRSSLGVSLEAKASPDKQEFSGKIEAKNENGADASLDEKYANIMMRTIGINDLISELQDILDAIDIKYLYIFLDDFSELPIDEMKLVVNAIIFPFSRWSNFIRFKVAAYPGKIYLGDLDKTKVEEIHLDIYALYGSADVANMEEKSIDFTRRILLKRLKHFCGRSANSYFDSESHEFWRTMFYATMANPRIIGHIALYAYESNLLYQRPIGIKAIQEAAKRYYEEKVSPFFSSGRFRDVSFHERSTIFSLKELMESIVKRSRDLKTYKDSRVTKAINGRTPSSHFFVSKQYDDLFTTLELTFFVTKYYEQSDRDGMRVSIFSLNFGLCEKFQITFGRPLNHSLAREARAYFIERIFDYNGIIRAYLHANQEIKCGSCGEVFAEDQLPALRMFRMRCPSCQAGTVSVINLSKKYADMIESVNAELLLPETEIGMLQILNSERKPMFASQIAVELDCSGQLIGKRAKNLAERGLVDRQQAGTVKSYSITNAAIVAYFSDEASNDLDVDNE